MPPKLLTLPPVPIALWLWRAAFCLLLFHAVAGFLPAVSAAQSDWLAQTRARISASKFEEALTIVSSRVSAAPEDMEALGWRARIQQWMGRLDEAEADYRAVLAKHPNDSDMLVGLANVLARKGRNHEALEALDRASLADPQRTDVHIRRGHVLRAMERRPEARAAFQHALILAPGDSDARSGLDSLQPEARHEISFGSDIDRFNYTSVAGSFGANLRSKLSERWTSNVGGTFYDRFGGRATRLAGSITMRIPIGGALTLGGAGAPRDGNVIARRELFFEYDRGFSVSRTGWVRGVEMIYHQRWLWFRGANVLTLSPGAILYLPRDWTFSLRITAARSVFAIAPLPFDTLSHLHGPAQWSPSGAARLGFPLVRNLTGNLFFAVGTENFVQVDEVGRFSARTWGGGLRWAFRKRQWISGYLLYQDRSQERTQTSFGLAYGLSF